MENKTLRNSFLGIGLMIAYALAMVISDSIAKELTSLTTIFTIVWYRYIFHTISLSLLSARHRFNSDKNEVVGNHGIQILRGFLLVTSTCAFFTSIASMPLAEAMGLLYIFPIVSVVLSGVFLKEKISHLQKFLILLSFIGANLVINTHLSTMITPSLFALAGGVLMGLYLFLTKLLSRHASPSVSSLYSGIVGIALVPLLPGFEFVLLQDLSLVLAISMGILAAIGHYCMFLSMRFASASVVSPFAFFEVVFAAIIGMLWFNDTLTPIAGVGILLIVVTGVILAIHSNRSLNVQGDNNAIKL